MVQEAGNYRHWKTEQDSDGILRLILDRADAAVNTLSRDVMDELDGLLQTVPGHDPVGMILCSGKKSGFAAGADVSEFTSVESASEACEYVDRIHTILDRLEGLPFPTVCVIHGFCLGGGLELALACRYRVVVDGPETVLGLPEVKLGIHPGFGGTVRLVRTIGPLRAMDMILSGRNIRARQAHRIGLADFRVPERQWERAAGTILHNPPPRKKPALYDKLRYMRFSRSLLSIFLRRKISRRAAPEHYPAPYAVIDLWNRCGGDQSAMFREESRSVSSLVTTDTSRNLVRVFQLGERLRSLGNRDKQNFRNVHVLGAGTMGADIAAWCALQGMRVTIQDVDNKRLAKAVNRASGFLHKKLGESLQAERALDRFIPDPEGEGVRLADVVIEAIFENTAAKCGLYREVEPKMHPDALLATNTSSIPLETLSEAVQHTGRFVGLHFFNPVSRMQLVEVVRGRHTDAERFDRAVSFVSAIRRLPLPVSSSPGFLVNRLLTPYLLEAILMQQEGISSGDIDRAAEEFGMPMGPLLLADTVGLDICLSVGRILSGPLNLEVPKRLEDLVGAGRLGKKSGLGFYRYKNGRIAGSKHRKRSPLNDEIRDRMIMRLLNESVSCLRAGIVSDRSFLDAGAVYGMGFAPFRGGPVSYIQSKGIEAMVERSRQLEAHYGERFAPDSGWRDLEQENS